MLVLSAALLTLSITFALTLYAFTTKSDFTAMGASLFMFSIGK
jgi:FtsH-binding integral membrane protein